VFTDMILPGINGAEIIKKLSEHTPDLKYILCSGYTQNNRKAVAELQGEDRYLQKPYSITDLLRIVKRTLP
jgi:DNA-binding NtrC family response regulator